MISTGRKVRVKQMNFLKERIEKDGKVLSPSVLKVDGFLNHSIDVQLMDEIGKAFAEAFHQNNITKVITIESGGIAPAMTTAFHLNVPMVFAKKAKPSTMSDPVYTTVHSFTKNTDYTLCIERSALSEDDNVLFIDDFLANGQAFEGICHLLEKTGSNLGGVGICIGKSWQKGQELVMSRNVPLWILVSIQKMTPEEIVWDEPSAWACE